MGPPPSLPDVMLMLFSVARSRSVRLGVPVVPFKRGPPPSLGRQFSFSPFPPPEAALHTTRKTQAMEDFRGAPTTSELWLRLVVVLCTTWSLHVTSTDPNPIPSKEEKREVSAVERRTRYLLTVLMWVRAVFLVGGPVTKADHGLVGADSSSPMALLGLLRSRSSWLGSSRARGRLGPTC